MSGPGIPAPGMSGGWSSSAWELGTEGFYLKGYGVVYCANLPHRLFPAYGVIGMHEPPKPKPRVRDQVRRELQGDI